MNVNISYFRHRQQVCEPHFQTTEKQRQLNQQIPPKTDTVESEAAVYHLPLIPPYLKALN